MLCVKKKPIVTALCLRMLLIVLLSTNLFTKKLCNWARDRPVQWCCSHGLPGESAWDRNTKMSSRRRPHQRNNTAWQGQGWTRRISRSTVLACYEHVCRLRGVKCGTPVASPSIERMDVFFQTTARLISADAIATITQESIVGKQSKCRGENTRYVAEIENKKQMTQNGTLGNSWRCRLKLKKKKKRRRRRSILWVFTNVPDLFNNSARVLPPISSSDHLPVVIQNKSAEYFNPQKTQTYQMDLPSKRSR